jgi:hypothetical protein
MLQGPSRACAKLCAICCARYLLHLPPRGPARPRPARLRASSSLTPLPVLTYTDVLRAERFPRRPGMATADPELAWLRQLRSGRPALRHRHPCRTKANALVRKAPAGARPLAVVAPASGTRATQAREQQATIVTHNAFDHAGVRIRRPDTPLEVSTDLRRNFV